MSSLPTQMISGAGFDAANSLLNCHIGSMVVYCKPEHQESLVRSCEQMADCTVYTGDRKTAFVLVIESDDEAGIKSVIALIHALPNVINASLVYHHCDSQDSLSEEIST